MNWQTISFDWNQARAFLATVEEGSFSGAARAMKTTQPTIGRQVTGLEETLGVVLFERAVRGPILTDVGRSLVDHMRTMGEAATLISLVASGQAQQIAGEVIITASDLMCATILPPLLLDLQAEAPGLRIRLVAANDISDLSKRDADIAIRHVRPTQADLIARHVGDFRANFYASSRYLESVGRLGAPSDIAAHRFVGTSDPEQISAVLRDRGYAVRDESFVVATNSGPATWEMVKAGLGIGLLPEVLGDNDTSVERAIPDLPSIEFPVWIATHRELRTSRRIRLAFDGLARGLQRVGGSVVSGRQPRQR